MSIFVDIEKNLGAFHLNVHFEAGEETLALLGSSGCGKSMTLKCIAGIEKPDRGKIVVDGITLFDSERRINLSPQERQTGLMFQNYALFPNMTVLQNLQAGARRQKQTTDKLHRNRFFSTPAAPSSAASSSDADFLKKIMETFGLMEYANHYPHQLSGGQQQRTALARILVSNPHILLLDEPFSALDSHLRFQLEQELRQVLKSFGKTAVLVSHDREEVYRLAHKIAVMDHGQIQALGTPKEVFANPQTKQGAVLTGCKNISDLCPLANGQFLAKDWGITLQLSDLPPQIRTVGIRMHDIQYGPGENEVLCQVLEEIENPFSFTILLTPIGQTAESPIGWELPKETWLRLRSKELCLHFPQKNLLFLKKE